MTEPSDSTAPELKTALPDKPFKKRVAQLDEYYDVRTFSTKLRKSVKKQKEREHKYAIVTRRLIDDRGRHYDTVIDIKSARLCNVLLDINKGVEDLALSRKEPEATEELMYYSYPGLLAHLAVEQDQEERDELLICDIQTGIFYINEYLGNTMKDVEQMVSQREISFDVVWALFFPNSLVYSHHTNADQDTVLIVRRSGYNERRREITIDGSSLFEKTKYLEVVCDIIHHDGQEFGFARRIFEIDMYLGTRPIATLPVYPLQYHDDNDGVYSRAMKLGKRLVQMPTHCFREIRGRASRRVDRRETEPRSVNGRVMISPLAYARFHSTISPTVHLAIKKDSLTDDQYAICSPILMGFAFDRKIWGEFALTHARDVDWNDAAFDALVLGKEQKKLIHSLVRQHAKKETNFDDIIKGKGQGLIGLLSGTPGCGKTLTAEAVAEVTHKPLYILSAGELGITPTSLESTLVSVLELAQIPRAQRSRVHLPPST
ncbi:P-loop containing nucleoside triphosphate hydrolase protein [Amanita rubescens]|nr:P-loop containing nucleoside triphosphate hydrolase protein [Amanita rubescens]